MCPAPGAGTQQIRTANDDVRTRRSAADLHLVLAVVEQELNKAKVGAYKADRGRVQFDWLVVGAGLSGATIAERIASQLDNRVLVIDRRAHVAGNAYDELNDDGIRVHKYGAHIFHTSSHQVWKYLSKFTEWRPYFHKVEAVIDGKSVPIPFNLASLETLLPGASARRLEKLLLEQVGHEKTISVHSLLHHAHPDLRSLGEYVFEKVFLHYTVKQWGVRPNEIDRSVTARVPILVSRNSRYFRDTYQALPRDGYTALVRRMLSHPNISVELNTDFSHVAKSSSWRHVVYTGSLDELASFRFGPLPYRSLQFEHHHLDVDRFQSVPVVNYPGPKEKYTRILEHNNFLGQPRGHTVITYEFPEAHTPGANEPYYPILCPANRDLYSLYRGELDGLPYRIVVSGRLADYKYYDMDQAVAHALLSFKREVAGLLAEPA